MNSTRPFYIILIPNNSREKKYYFIWSQGIPEWNKIWYPKIISGGVCKQIFLLKEKYQNYFCTECPNGAVRGLRGGIRNKKVWKNQEVSCVEDIFVKGKF